VIVYVGSAEMYAVATGLFALGLLTDALDGFVARRWHVESKLGTVILEPVCDFLLGVSAILVLTTTDVWSWWVLWVTLAVLAMLQSISQIDLKAQKRHDYDESLIKNLKRHQYYIHPIFFVGVEIITFMVLVFQASESWVLLAVIGLIVGGVVYMKKWRILDMIAGPK